jgi:hypothetical protein
MIGDPGVKRRLARHLNSTPASTPITQHDHDW